MVAKQINIDPKEKTINVFVDDITISEIKELVKHFVEMDDYEILIHNSFEKILEYFNQIKDNSKQQVSLFFNQKNKYLEKVFHNVFKELKEQIKEKENVL